MRLSLLILILGALIVGLACTNNAISTVAKTQPSNSTSNTVADDAARISLEDAKKDFDAGTAVFIDARDVASYKFTHIKGAINIPLLEAENRLKEIPTDKKIIAYCSWQNEHTSAGLVQILNKNGIKNAYALVGGTNAWVNAGYPTEKSEETPK